MSNSNVVEVTELRQLDDLNLKALSADIAEVLGKHLGGEFGVRISNLDHTHVGFSDDQLSMRFHITDKSWSERFVKHHVHHGEE
jgi:hypothetical protein